MTDRELDAWISCNVLGWHTCSHKECTGFHDPHNNVHSTFPSPTTDAAAAFSVLKKCAGEGGVRLGFNGITKSWFIWRASGLGKVHESHAETLELAICRFCKALYEKEKV